MLTAKKAEFACDLTVAQTLVTLTLRVALWPHLVHCGAALLTAVMLLKCKLCYMFAILS